MTGVCEARSCGGAVGIGAACNLCPNTPAGQSATISGCRVGDLNCDGSVNFKDINPFVAPLSGGLDK